MRFETAPSVSRDLSPGTDLSASAKPHLNLYSVLSRLVAMILMSPSMRRPRSTALSPSRDHTSGSQVVGSVFTLVLPFLDMDLSFLTFFTPFLDSSILSLDNTDMYISWSLISSFGTASSQSQHLSFSLLLID